MREGGPADDCVACIPRARRRAVRGGGFRVRGFEEEERRGWREEERERMREEMSTESASLLHGGLGDLDGGRLGRPVAADAPRRDVVDGEGDGDSREELGEHSAGGAH